MWNDVRYGFRTLLRSPGFTAVAVVAIALGVGANTAVFTIVNSVLLRPLPFPKPERLFALSAVPENLPFASGPMLTDGLYLEFRKQDRLFEKLTAFNSGRVNMTGTGDAQSVQAAFVTADFFSVLRARPALGRIFLPEEDQNGRDNVVVLSDKLWRADFAGDPGAIGKSVRVDGVSHTIIGIMPAGFAFPAALDLWVPRGVRIDGYNSMLMSVIGRLKPGVKPAQAAAELSVAVKRMPGESSEDASKTPARVISLLEYVSGKAQRSLLIFLGGGVRSFDRLRERSQPDAGARGGTPPGDCGARGYGREPLASDASVARRERAGRAGGWRGGLAAGTVGHTRARRASSRGHATARTTDRD
jgi:putative ABC transport system permease protein